MSNVCSSQLLFSQRVALVKALPFGSQLCLVPGYCSDKDKKTMPSLGSFPVGSPGGHGYGDQGTLVFPGLSWFEN